MRKKPICFHLTLLLLLFTFPIILHIHPANAEETTIYIRADGSIHPPTAPISTVDNITYTLTDDVINGSIVIERNGITLDGMRHKVLGTGFLGKAGINITQVNEVTIKRVKISNASPGVWMFECGNCVLQENELTTNTYGIYPNFSNNTAILKNRIMNSAAGGIYLSNSLNFSIRHNLIAANPHFNIGLQGSTNSTIAENVIAHSAFGIRIFFSNNIAVYNNNFVNNTNNAFNLGSIVTWNSRLPAGGNYWSNYNGVDSNDDEIGDTSYIIDTNNIDQYPLIRPLTLTLLGDINYDGIVDILDLTAMASIYGIKEGTPNWIPQADLARPYGVINMIDVVTCVAHYKQTYP